MSAKMVEIGNYNELFMLKIYTLFRNVDESILKLNKYIKKYQFVKFDLLEVKDRFFNLFNMPNSFTSEEYFVNYTGQELDRYFCDAINWSKLSDFGFFNRYYMIFLETIDYDVKVKIDGKEYFAGDTNSVLYVTHEYVKHLTQCLRLTFPGYTVATVTFLINLSSKEIPIRFYGSGSRHEEKTLCIDESKFEQFNNLIQNKLPISNDLLLTLEYFNASYTVEYDMVRFIILITALESIFSISHDQITHTVARHSSLLLSNTKEEFQNNYSKIKKLYNQRSNFIHGTKDKIVLLEEDIDFTEELVRKAIIFWINLGQNKQQLFNYFNRLGYPE